MAFAYSPNAMAVSSALSIGIKTKTGSNWHGMGGGSGYSALVLNPTLPGSGNAQLKGSIWANNEMTCFDGNTVQFTNGSLSTSYLQRNTTYRKFFFVPVPVTITDADGTIWTITPKSGRTDQVADALVCSDDTRNLYTSHKWPYMKDVTTTTSGETITQYITDDTSLKTTLDGYNIKYDDGCFGNTTLYATSSPNTEASYTKIAYLDAATGKITLYRDGQQFDNATVAGSVIDKLMNAVGYADNSANVCRQLHAWVGIAVNDGNNRAADVYNTHGTDDSNYGIWAVSWPRPVNLATTTSELDMTDTETGKVEMFDELMLYDWRGPSKGNMQGNLSLWEHYNIKQIDIDCTPANITTDMDGGTLGTTPLSSKCSTRMFSATNGTTDAAVSFSKNGYAGNSFTARIPVTVIYEWGTFKGYKDVKIVCTSPAISGDANGDGKITMNDANMVVNYYLDPSRSPTMDVNAADVNGDGKITVNDANIIVNMYLAQ